MAEQQHLEKVQRLTAEGMQIRKQKNYCGWRPCTFRGKRYHPGELERKFAPGNRMNYGKLFFFFCCKRPRREGFRRRDNAFLLCAFASFRI